MPDAAATSILVEVLLGDGSYEREGLTLFMSDFDQVSIALFAAVPWGGCSTNPDPFLLAPGCPVPVRREAGHSAERAAT